MVEITCSHGFLHFTIDIVATVDHHIWWVDRDSGYKSRTIRQVKVIRNQMNDS